MKKLVKKKSIIIAICLSLVLSLGLGIMSYAEPIDNVTGHGDQYKLKKAQYIRTGPGTNYRIKKRSELSKHARKYYAVPGIKKAKFKKGVVVTSLKEQGKWMKISSGWIRKGSGYLKKQ